MKIIVSKDSNELSKNAADWLVKNIADVLTRQDRFTIALSGGSTPKKLFELLASDAYHNKIDWRRLHFFWGDERFVPFEDDRNNAKMAFEELLNKVPVNKAQVHIMPTEMEPAEAVASYEKILHAYFDARPVSLDLVMLGLGDDGHTLSLFPGYEVVHENQKWVAAFYLKEQSMYRITLTKAIVNTASQIIFLVAGGSKANAVKEVIKGKPDADRYPAQVIRPNHDELYWFLDEAAAAGL